MKQEPTPIVSALTTITTIVTELSKNKRTSQPTAFHKIVQVLYMTRALEYEFQMNIREWLDQESNDSILAAIKTVFKEGKVLAKDHFSASDSGKDAYLDQFCHFKMLEIMSRFKKIEAYFSVARPESLVW
jgi:hypothetical protein